MSARCLLLNSTYEPLGIVGLQRAVRLLFARKAEIVADLGRPIVSAGNAVTKEIVAFPLPSIIRLLYYVRHRRETVALTKKNVLMRDDYRCAYCGMRGGSEMTVDHVIPRSRGGLSTWTNLVAACVTCNSRKRDRLLADCGMRLLRKPYQPRHIPWVVIKRHTMPDEWSKYLTLYGIGIEERCGQ